MPQTDVWRRHGIDHLSASSLGAYRNEPALFVLKYLYGFKDDVGAAAWRGTAVEAGLDQMLYGSPYAEALAIAEGTFEREAQGEASDEITKERVAIPYMLELAFAKLKERGKPLARQLKVSHALPGIEIPVIGYVDYTFEADLVDLKTTHRLPSEPQPDHAAQVTLYHDALKKSPLLLYATTKKAELYGLNAEQIKVARWTLLRSALALKAFLARSESRERAAELCAPNFDNYRWSDAAKAKAMEIWA